MVANALSVLCILPDTPAFDLKEGPLDISKTNPKILQSLCRYSTHMDDERYEFNQDHWRLYFKNLELEDAGHILTVEPCASRNKLR